MRWRNLGQSDNIEDRRGSSGQRMGGPGIPLRGPIGIVVLLVVIVAGAYGVDLTPLLTGGGGLAPQTSTQESYRGTPEEEEMARFTSAVLKSTEETWDSFFTQAGEHYPPPKLVLYTGATQTACGYGQAAMGPFYCPADRTVFIDLAFYRDMKNKLGGGGDFAQGYVIAHEVGHHVQHLLGIDAKVRQAQAGASPKEANRLSVLMELQADCFAGVWGHMMKQEGILEAGDLETALNTAQAIGDDRLQRQSGGRVVPDSFTHGSSQQRLTWFKRGFDSGDPAVCDTFAKDK